MTLQHPKHGIIKLGKEKLPIRDANLDSLSREFAEAALTRWAARLLPQLRSCRWRGAS